MKHSSAIPSCPTSVVPPLAPRKRTAPAGRPALLGLAAALTGALLLGGCTRGHRDAAAVTRLPPARVRLATVHVENVRTLVEVTGVVRPAQRAQLAAKVMGAIEEMPVTLGQAVRTGDLLVKISAGEISARVVQAQSQLNAARRDLERERDLLAKGASTADLVKGLEDRFAAAQAMVHEAETMLGYTSVRAPFDGVVARKLADAGDLASPGVPLLEVEATSHFQIEAAIPDSLAVGLAPGAPLAAQIPAVGASFDGTLAEISSAADPNAHTVLAKIAVPAGIAVRSGAFARVQVPGEPVAALLVPRTAISRLGQMERVFVASGDRAVLRLVKTGADRGENVEVLSGLDDGESLVLSPPPGLQEGQPLERSPTS